MIWRRILRWLFPTPFQKLLTEAAGRGRVSLSQVDIGDGRVGWYASIRPTEAGRGPHSHRYAWTGQHPELATALEDACVEAREFPVMVDMTVDTNRPRLGGKEFDE